MHHQKSKYDHLSWAREGSLAPEPGMRAACSYQWDLDANLAQLKTHLDRQRVAYVPF